MNVAQLQDAQALKAGGEAGNKRVDFAQAELGALNQRAVAERRERRGHREIGGGIEGPPSRRVASRQARQNVCGCGPVWR